MCQSGSKYLLAARPFHVRRRLGTGILSPDVLPELTAQAVSPPRVRPQAPRRGRWTDARVSGFRSQAVPMRTPRPVEVNGFARTPQPFPREAREPRVTCALPAASPALRLLQALRTRTRPCHEVVHRGECPQHTARGRLSPELPPPSRGDPGGRSAGCL